MVVDGGGGDWGGCGPLGGGGVVARIGISYTTQKLPLLCHRRLPLLQAMGAEKSDQEDETDERLKNLAPTVG